MRKIQKRTAEQLYNYAYYNCTYATGYRVAYYVED